LNLKRGGRGGEEGEKERRRNKNKRPRGKKKRKKCGTVLRKNKFILEKENILPF
jgi:hypothetical protein